MSAIDPHAELERHIDAANGVRKLGRKWGIPASSISDARQRDKTISEKILSKMGIRVQRTFTRRVAK
jgi:hypothetical protein